MRVVSSQLSSSAAADSNDVSLAAPHEESLQPAGARNAHRLPQDGHAFSEAPALISYVSRATQTGPSPTPPSESQPFAALKESYGAISMPSLSELRQQRSLEHTTHWRLLINQTCRELLEASGGHDARRVGCVATSGATLGVMGAAGVSVYALSCSAAAALSAAFGVGCLSVPIAAGLGQGLQGAIKHVALRASGKAELLAAKLMVMNEMKDRLEGQHGLSDHEALLLQELTAKLSAFDNAFDPHVATSVGTVKTTAVTLVLAAAAAAVLACTLSVAAAASEGGAFCHGPNCGGCCEGGSSADGAFCGSVYSDCLSFPSLDDTLVLAQGHNGPVQFGLHAPRWSDILSQSI